MLFTVTTTNVFMTINNEVKNDGILHPPNNTNNTILTSGLSTY